MFSQLNLPLIASSLAVSWIVGVAIHELGHAVAGRLAGVRISACGIGFHPWWHVQVFGIRFYVGWPLTGGLTTFLSDDLDFARGKVAAMIAGGPLANVLSALVAGWLWWLGFLPGFVPEFCVMSALLATNGLVPFSVQKKTATFRTDALLFAQLCRGTHHRWADSAVSLGTMLFLRNFYSGLDFLPGVVHSTVGAALNYAVLGDCEQAALTLSDESLQDPHRGSEAVIAEAFTRAFVASADSADFADRMAAARDICAADTTAIISLDLIDADWRHRHGLEAAAIIANAVRASREARLPAIQAAAEALALEVEAPDDLAQRCRSLLRRGGARSLTEDGALGLLTAVARVCAERGDDHNARQFFAKALDAISRIAAHIPGEQTRQRFLKSKGDALRRAAIAGDGVPAFVPELTEPRRPRVHLSKVGLSLFAAGLMIGALGLAAQFVNEIRDRTVVPSHILVVAELPVLLFGFLGMLACLLAIVQPFASHRQAIWGLAGNCFLIFFSLTRITTLHNDRPNRAVAPTTSGGQQQTQMHPRASR